MTAFKGPLKWGFFGAGKITMDFATVIGSFPKTQHIPLGIAARDITRAKTFARECGIQKSFESYRQLAEDPEIDIIYIGTVNSEHYSQAKLAMEHSKHVLVEKPICVNYSQCKDLIDTARKKGVFLMEGFWTNAFPAARKLFSEIRNGSAGDIIAITLEVGQDFGHMDRFRKRELGGGILLNHGVYGIMLTYLLLGNPDVISAIGHLTETGVDEICTLTLSYKDKRCMSNVIMSSRTKLPAEFRVMTTKGVVKLPFPFWAPQKCETPTEVFTYDLPVRSSLNGRRFNYMYAPGFIYEIEEVYRCISEGHQESPLMPWDASLGTMRIADEARKQLGVTFPQDGGLEH
ncbi:Trans-1,2-dihydrobenzene-1,2-diol dehydrogenase [Orchesella cincta]|uniref:Trans-1,2-dihydrobenzene-1,2-diol dehydrogenase n=1 Tax=Orchesella cincta TaxID=48709 RepID=A0A1D2MMZ2_ORCCI|nr:Trans-1,2-dihydrobenzene-1,2-diol dehydrogenase [Orchesella cincta]